MKYTFPEARILIFTKAPVPGKCKTRLIPCLGEEGAAKLQERLINKIINDLDDFQLCPFEIWQSETTNYFTERVLKLKNNIEIHTQSGNNLGQRMSNALNDGLKRSTKLIIIGSDCIDYSKHYLTTALLALSKQQIVIGPAYDGGYVLIGATSFYPDIFKDICWGTEYVFEQTIQKLTLLGLEFTQLNRLHDIDTPNDLERISCFVG